MAKAKKKAGARKVTTPSTEQPIRHARIELPDTYYQRLKTVADRFRISIAGYIRLAVMERVERDEGKGGGKE